jgi:hypothetical protein
MPVWKIGAATSRVATVVTAALLCVSCGPAEQGYWTKQGIPQALTNEPYAADSQHCDRFAAQNDGRYSDKAREKRYTKCMSARGYQWVVEEPGSLSEKSGGQSSRAPCPAGYTNCDPGGTKDGGLNPEVNQRITQGKNPYPKAESLPPHPSRQSSEKGHVEDRECRDQADATLSSPYGVYVACMQEKGWSSPPVVGAPADSAETEKTDLNKGHPLEDIGRRQESEARNVADEIPKIGLASGSIFTADSAETEKTEPNKGHLLEDIGQGLKSAAKNIEDEIPKFGSAIGKMFTNIGLALQSAASNIGNEIPKIGPAIGNMFKQLTDKDTRDKDKEKASNKVAPPPKDKKKVKPSRPNEKQVLSAPSNYSRSIHPVSEDSR